MQGAKICVGAISIHYQVLCVLVDNLFIYIRIIINSVYKEKIFMLLISVFSDNLVLNIAKILRFSEAEDFLSKPKLKH